MQSRKKAVILPVGMLLKVEIEPFMAKMIAVAKAENPDFAFSEVQNDAFALCGQFNRDKIKRDAFAAEMLKLLGIKTMKPSAFWAEWNAMVDVTGLKDGITRLQETSQQHDILFYLISDTNEAHARKLREKAKEQKVRVSINNSCVSTIAGMPFYPSFQCKKARYGLIESVIEKINAQATQPESITVLCGDPLNFSAGSALRNKAELELKRVREICHKMGANVALHNGDLAQTFEKLFAVSAEQSQKLAM